MVSPHIGSIHKGGRRYRSSRLFQCSFLWCGIQFIRIIRTIPIQAHNCLWHRYLLLYLWWQSMDWYRLRPHRSSEGWLLASVQKTPLRSPSPFHFHIHWHPLDLRNRYKPYLWFCGIVWRIRTWSLLPLLHKVFLSDSYHLSVQPVAGVATVEFGQSPSWMFLHYQRHPVFTCWHKRSPVGDATTDTWTASQWYPLYKPHQKLVSYRSVPHNSCKWWLLWLW